MGNFLKNKESLLELKYDVCSNSENNNKYVALLNHSDVYYGVGYEVIQELSGTISGNWVDDFPGDPEGAVLENISSLLSKVNRDSTNPNVVVNNSILCYYDNVNNSGLVNSNGNLVFRIYYTESQQRDFVKGTKGTWNFKLIKFNI